MYIYILFVGLCIYIFIFCCLCTYIYYLLAFVYIYYLFVSLYIYIICWSLFIYILFVGAVVYLYILFVGVFVHKYKIYGLCGFGVAGYLQRLVDQMENRIKRVQQRIDANNQPVALTKENEERCFKP